MPKIADYLKSPDGKPSSTRWFSSLFMWYFFVINILIMLLIFLGNQALDINTIIFISMHDFLILLAIFAPKQLGKINEMKELIALAKYNGNPDPAKPPEEEETK